MSQNSNSTSGMLEDLIRNLQQIASAELHAKTALEKAENEVTTAEPEDLTKASEKVMNAEKHLNDVTEVRRDVMRLIQRFANSIDETKWCEVKHLAMAAYTAFEAYQAINDVEIYNYYIQCNNLFIEAVSDWLGLDILPCASCFSDALKGLTEDGVQ